MQTNRHSLLESLVQEKFVYSQWMVWTDQIPLLSCIFQATKLMKIVLNEMEVLVGIACYTLHRPKTKLNTHMHCDKNIT